MWDSLYNFQCILCKTKASPGSQSCLYYSFPNNESYLDFRKSEVFIPAFCFLEFLSKSGWFFQTYLCREVARIFILSFCCCKMLRSLILKEKISRMNEHIYPWNCLKVLWLKVFFPDPPYGGLLMWENGWPMITRIQKDREWGEHQKKTRINK